MTWIILGVVVWIAGAVFASFAYGILSEHEEFLGGDSTIEKVMEFIAMYCLWWLVLIVVLPLVACKLGARTAQRRERE